jgi:hypothetical protein
MQILGIIFLVILALIVLTGIVVVLFSLPDYARYRRVRRM